MQFIIQWTLAGIIFGEQIEQGSGTTEKTAAKAAWKAFKARNSNVPFRVVAIHRAGQLSLFEEGCHTTSISGSGMRRRSKRGVKRVFAANVGSFQAPSFTAQIALNLGMSISGRES